MTATFNKAGIQFQYPENWEITDENMLDIPRTVSLQSPGGGFWALMLYEDPVDPKAVLEETLSQMREEYENLESSEHVEQFDDIEASGYEMFFYCFDLLVCARAIVIQDVNDQTFLIICQAEDRDFTRYEPVFRAITTSLLRNAVTE
jgi:hypothetical protein